MTFPAGTFVYKRWCDVGSHSRGAKRAGANVISQVRLWIQTILPHFRGRAWFSDESHCSPATPMPILGLGGKLLGLRNKCAKRSALLIREEIELGEVSIREVPRFILDPQTEAARSKNQ